MDFGGRLRNLREQKGCSVHELATALDKSDSTIRMWEIGKAKPDADTLCLLSDFFDVSIDYLFGRSIHRNESNQIIHNALGLSEGAMRSIKALRSGTLYNPTLKKNRMSAEFSPSLIDVLNTMLSDNRFAGIITTMSATINLLQKDQAYFVEGSLKLKEDGSDLTLKGFEEIVLKFASAELGNKLVEILRDIAGKGEVTPDA